MKMVMLTVLLIYPLDRILCNYYKDTSENFVMTWVNAHDKSIYDKSIQSTNTYRSLCTRHWTEAENYISGSNLHEV